MIRPFKHISSKFHSIQNFVNYLFLEVVFRAPSFAEPSFDCSLILNKYKPLLEEVDKSYLMEPIMICFERCKKLSPKNLKILKRGVHYNNKIRLLCNGELTPLEYEDITKIDNILSKALKLFFNNLYDQAIKKSIFYNKYGTVDDYYRDLVGKSRTCRCCGINKVLIKYHSKRGALDHYLPRNDFPFTSINTNNLFPICDTCNSKYKLADNTIFEILKQRKIILSKTRRKAFFPFSKITPYPVIDLQINLNRAFDNNFAPSDMSIHFICPGYEEQINTWESLFGIKENYLSECSSDEMRAYYEEQYIADILFGKSHEQYIESLERNRLGDMNFLKIAFLNGVNSYS